METDKNGWLDEGCKRTFGFYPNYDSARESLHENRCDMNETCYNYAIVEELDIGIHPIVRFKQWFKWNKEREGFFEIEEPEEAKHFTNFALG